MITSKKRQRSKLNSTNDKAKGDDSVLHRTKIYNDLDVNVNEPTFEKEKDRSRRQSPAHNSRNSSLNKTRASLIKEMREAHKRNYSPTNVKKGYFLKSQRFQPVGQSAPRTPLQKARSKRTSNKDYDSLLLFKSNLVDPESMKERLKKFSTSNKKGLTLNRNHRKSVGIMEVKDRDVPQTRAQFDTYFDAEYYNTDYGPTEDFDYFNDG